MTPPSQTALERAVTAGEPRARVTPLDALRAARRMWLTDMRIDMGALAGELGVSRATLYNWVGDGDRLPGEVLGSIAERTIEQGRQEAGGSGPDYISAVVEHSLPQLALFEPTRRFIERDPE